MHPDGPAHRKAVNEALYRLSDQRFAALRGTLLQLRRPKLSDKLDEKGLNRILRDSLPPVSEAIVKDLADGFERLDRHASAVDELAEVVGNLHRIRAAHHRYARVASAARADAVTAAESALEMIRQKSASAEKMRDDAATALDSIASRRQEIDTRLSQIRGRTATLTHLDAYAKGMDVEPLRELVATLRKTVQKAAEAAQRAGQRRDADARAAERAIEAAVASRDHAANERAQASAVAPAARSEVLDGELGVALDSLAQADATDQAATELLIKSGSQLIRRLDSDMESWLSQVNALAVLANAASTDEHALAVARTETGRAQTDVSDAEQVVNERLDDDRLATVTWLGNLEAWAERSPQLRAGQAPPLPWDPETAIERAARWVKEAGRARSDSLLAEQDACLQAARDRDSAADAADAAADRLAEIAALVGAAAAAAAAYGHALTEFLAAVTAWARSATELRRGVEPPDLELTPLNQVARTAAGWAERAAEARARTLLAEEADLRADISRVSDLIQKLAARERHLEDGGLPELVAPPTRQADRTRRPGAPLFLLVDFASDVGNADRLGIEAAAIGSGVADAWLSPDGQLLRGDGMPLLDTQLDVRSPSASGPTLADVLIPDDDCIDAGVPPQVTSAVLSRIGYAPSASTGGRHMQLQIGRDGSWRAGVLSGAHRVAAVTLIGATNREAARLAALGGDPPNAYWAPFRAG